MPYYITVPEAGIYHDFDTGDPACDTNGWTIKHAEPPKGVRPCPVCCGKISAVSPLRAAFETTETPAPKRRRRR